MTPHDNLARYQFPDILPRHYRADDLRNTRTRDVEVSDDYARAARVPSPLTMAELFARPLIEAQFGTVHRISRDARRFPRLTAASGDIAVVTIGDLVTAAILALPTRDDVDPIGAYANLALIVAEGNAEWIHRYAADIATAATRRGVFPAPPVERTPAPARRPARTVAERKADERARERDAEARSARAWLAMFQDDAAPGYRIDARDLYDAAVDAISDYIDDEDELDDGGAWRVPGLRVFYAAADDLLGARQRTATSRFYILPTIPAEREDQPDMETAADIRSRADAIREEADALAYRNDETQRALDLLERQQALFTSGDLRGALTVQAERHGALIDAADRFRRAG
ncbi:hypothetical protein CH252_33005 [Rhodococcus sp. 06-1477-1B]|nr:hypothetical protein CH252_33005 [Rhodococcus sp. 06-1477-1B]